MQLTLEVSKSFAALSGNRDFGVVMEWMRTQYQNELDTLLVSTNPVLVHKHQGYALCLADFLRSATATTKAIPYLGDGQRMNTA